MRDWIRRSFKNRIFITVLLVTLVPMLLCDVFIMQISMRRSGDMLYAQAQSELDTAAGIIDSALDTVDGVTAKLADSAVIRSALHRGRESDLLYQLMYRETENLNGFASIDVYDSDGARIYAGSLNSEAGSLPVYWGVLRAARECEGQTMQANGADGLVIARAVYGSDGEVSGYVLVRIPQGGFGALLGGSFGEQNDVFLLDGTYTAPTAYAPMRRSLRSARSCCPARRSAAVTTTSISAKALTRASLWLCASRRYTPARSWQRCTPPAPPWAYSACCSAFSARGSSAAISRSPSMSLTRR